MQVAAMLRKMIAAGQHAHVSDTESHAVARVEFA